jgi:rhamnulokinase
MAESAVYLAVDLGASGGRVLAGALEGGKLTLDEVHRFDNGPSAAADRLYWNVLSLWAEIQNGLRAAAARHGDRVVSVGVDTWGVDFALLGRGDELLGNPYHYRDKRTSGILDKAFQIVPREEIFAATGLQFMEFNTLYQLLAMKLANSPLLEAAKSFLMMPDLFHWLLTGVKANEQTDASTTQFYDPRTGDWAFELLAKFQLPVSILGRITPPGESLGRLRPAVVEQTGLKRASVVLPGAHDTASAVLAAPAASKASPSPDWCYISSGTWSLMGVETPAPVIDDLCRKRNFTNEAGVGKTTRLLKNIAGLWLVQECRRMWKQAGRDYSYSELVKLAEQAPPLVSLIDCDHGDFTAPRDMTERISAFCSRTGQPAPSDPGATIRCILESLALRYRQVLEYLEELTGGRIETIHIVGGGVQNRLLCQMAADAAGRRVVAGPVEATAIGNVMMQAISHGLVGSIGEAREIVRKSFDVEEYSPRQTDKWREAFERFTKLTRWPDA